VSLVEVLLFHLELKLQAFRLELGCAESRLRFGCRDEAFGPAYWIPRCDGFRVLSDTGEQGEVEDIFLDADGAVEALGVRFRGGSVRINQSRIVDVDAVQRLVLVAEPVASYENPQGNEEEEVTQCPRPFRNTVPRSSPSVVSQQASSSS
jgi:hypothetical protein